MRFARVIPRPIRIAVAASLVIASAAFGQDVAPETLTTGPDPTAAEALLERRAETQQELMAEREALSSLSADSPLREIAEARVETLRSIDSTLGRSMDERRTIDAMAPTPIPGEEGSRASIALLGELQEEIYRDRERLDALVGGIRAASEASDAADETFQETERVRRQAREARDAQPSPEADARLALAKLRSRAAQEEVHLHDLELRGDRASKQPLETRLEALEARTQSVVEALRSSPRGADEIDPLLVGREGDLARRLEAAARELAKAELRLQNVTARYASESDLAPPMLEELETLQIARDTAAQHVATLEGQRERLVAERDLRARWLSLIRDSLPAATRGEWQTAATTSADSYRRALLQRQGRIADLSERSNDLRRRLDDAALDASLRPALSRRREALDEAIAALSTDVLDIAHHERLERRFLFFVQAESGRVPVLQRVASVWGAAQDLWRYELTTVDDKAVTVGNAILAIILFVVGFSVSRRLSLRLRNLLDSRFQLEPGVAGAAQTAAFYVMLVSFSLIALRTVSFPLTAFTFAGGALAIGIGFGSQNVMNNFISGLILMIERPVRSNDLVEIDNTHGVIEHIGARSTRIRATDGRHLIVPNSFFLENNVVNWTLSDDLIRTKVSVGVVYGSPTRLVEQLIGRALEENSKVLGEPKPIIIFSGFGDNSLDFEAHFWTRARSPMAVNQLSGEIRFRIDDLFREHDLVIAFPQRDVHLDSVSPIDVRVVGAGRNASE